MEQLGVGLRGSYRDRLIGPGGRLIHDGGWVSNTIVMSCRELLAAFMRNDPNQPHGIEGLAVGAGKQEWDLLQELPRPDSAVRRLEQPHPDLITIAAGKLRISYVDPQTAKASASCTSGLEITATLEPGYPGAGAGAAALREFGLYGRLGDTVYLINYVIHRVIFKAEADTLIRVIRLSF